MWRDLALEVMSVCHELFATPCIYRFGRSGYGLVVPVVFGAETDGGPLGGIGVRGPAWQAAVLRSALAITPRQSDTLDLPDPEGVWRRYTVNAAAEQDTDRTIWTLKLKEESAMPQPTPALAYTVLKTAEGDAVNDVSLWDWAAQQTIAVDGTSRLSAAVDLYYARVVMVQVDRTCWVAGGSSTPVAAQDGGGTIRIEAGVPQRLVVEAGHKLAFIAAAGFAGTARVIPAK